MANYNTHKEEITASHFISDELKYKIDVDHEKLGKLNVTFEIDPRNMRVSREKSDGNKYTICGKIRIEGMSTGPFESPLFLSNDWKTGEENGYSCTLIPRSTYINMYIKKGSGDIQEFTLYIKEKLAEPTEDKPSVDLPF